MATAAPMATDEPGAGGALAAPAAAAAATTAITAAAGALDAHEEQPSAAHNYVVTAQRPTAVTHAVVGSFTAPGSVDLVLARATRLEVYTLTGEGLQVRERGREREREREREGRPRR
jgi:hypothetical protein